MPMTVDEFLASDLFIVSAQLMISSKLKNKDKGDLLEALIRSAWQVGHSSGVKEAWNRAQAVCGQSRIGGDNTTVLCALPKFYLSKSRPAR